MAKNKRFKKKNKKKFTQKQKRVIIPDETKRIIFGVLMFVMAVLIVLSFFGKAGPAGQTFMKASLFLFGKAGFTLPLLFVLAGLPFNFRHCWNFRKLGFLPRSSSFFKTGGLDRLFNFLAIFQIIWLLGHLNYIFRPFPDWRFNSLASFI